jgi:TRAP-type C4-dicarboxylate transport system substrate-binding protein
VTTPLRIAELVNTHTTFSGNRSFYVSFFIYAMNKAKYDAMPADLKKVIDANSGLETSKWAGRVMDEGDIPGFEAAKKRGNAIVELDAKETARWKQASQPVIDAWIKDMDAKGMNGKQLVEDTRALIAKYAGPAK